MGFPSLSNKSPLSSFIRAVAGAETGIVVSLFCGVVGAGTGGVVIGKSLPDGDGVDVVSDDGDEDLAQEFSINIRHKTIDTINDFFFKGSSNTDFRQYPEKA
jgi:hypothetical protein